VFVFLDMLPLNKPEVMIGNASQRFDEAGNLIDQDTRKHIRALLEALVDWTHHHQRGRGVAS
jgi:chromate reductase